MTSCPPTTAHLATKSAMKSSTVTRRPILSERVPAANTPTPVPAKKVKLAILVINTIILNINNIIFPILCIPDHTHHYYESSNINTIITVTVTIITITGHLLRMLAPHTRLNLCPMVLVYLDSTVQYSTVQYRCWCTSWCRTPSQCRPPGPRVAACWGPGWSSPHQRTRGSS